MIQHVVTPEMAAEHNAASQPETKLKKGAKKVIIHNNTNNTNNNNNNNKSNIIIPRAREEKKAETKAALLPGKEKVHAPLPVEADRNRFIPAKDLPFPIREILNAWNRLHIKHFYGLYPAGVEQAETLLACYDLDTILRGMDNISQSAFLLGKRNCRGFRITYGWMVKPENFAKVLAGKYRDHISLGDEWDEETDPFPRTPEARATAEALGIQLQ